MKRLIFATNNENKLREAREILNNFEILSQSDVGFLDEVIEDGISFAENALKKAIAGALFTNQIVFAEDSGICVHALDNAPGIFSARYSGGNDSYDNPAKLLKEMENIENRTAHFHCTIALVFPLSQGGNQHIFESEWHGQVAHEFSGNNGFAYDKIFIPNGYDKTSAELSSQEKNSISHRYQSLIKLKEFLDYR